MRRNYQAAKSTVITQSLQRVCRITWTSSSIKLVSWMLSHHHTLMFAPVPTHPITEYDRYVSAVVHDGEYFVVTPYNEHLPPLGTQRVQQQEDGHYGSHDWTARPQVFSKALCHFSCIPRYRKTSPYALMWWTPTTTDFEKQMSPNTW